MAPEFHSRKPEVITLRPHPSPSRNSTLSDWVLLHFNVTPAIQFDGIQLCLTGGVMYFTYKANGETFSGIFARE